MLAVAHALLSLQLRSPKVKVTVFLQMSLNLAIIKSSCHGSHPSHILQTEWEQQASSWHEQGRVHSRLICEVPPLCACGFSH